LTAKIVIADDEPDIELLVRQRFRKQIRDKSYSFLFAGDGSQALDLIESNPDVELVLSDINMPVMDGLTLIGKLKESHADVASVIVSAYGDMDNIRKAMNRGAFDFLTKPINFDDFEATVQKTLEQHRILREATATRSRLTRIERDLDIAAEIQQSLLPHTFPPVVADAQFLIDASMHPAREVGGDFYDYIQIDDHRVGLVIGDVSGKGVPAALFMAMSKALLKAAAQAGGTPGECLQRTNDLLNADNRANMFVTVFYAILDLRTGQLDYASGGHNPPYHVQRDRVVALPGTGGTVLGMIENLTYDSASIQLEPGDSLLLYTDGVTEAMNPDSSLFGEDRLEEILQRLGPVSPQLIIEGVFREVIAFAAGAPQSDDVTALAVQYRPSANR
jgi:sigma-B regulation protein RsbU (phosphoserine phosphatase)